MSGKRQNGASFIALSPGQQNDCHLSVLSANATQMMSGHQENLRQGDSPIEGIDIGQGLPLILEYGDENHENRFDVRLDRADRGVCHVDGGKRQ
jgi:hypothetical protein